MKDLRSLRSSREAGYSLAEALVVLAIVGMISVIAIPQFLTYQRAGRLKVALRNVTGDLRAARQRAVSQGHLVRISFSLDATRGSYQMYDGVTDSAGVTTWTALYPIAVPGEIGKDLDPTVRFYNSLALPTFADLDADTYRDIIYQSNGTIQGGTEGNVYLRFNQDLDVPVTQYKIEVMSSGMLKVTGSKV
jgi:type II secretory pathway pseudopilin PulG